MWGGSCDPSSRKLEFGWRERSVRVSPSDGAGYLQFSIVFGAGGSAGGKGMLDMVLTMARGYELGEPSDIVTEDNLFPLDAASFSKNGGENKRVRPLF